MNIRQKIGLILLLVFLSACGGGKTEGQLHSVIFSASASQSSITAEVAKWQDSNNDGICDSPTPLSASTELVFRVTKIDVPQNTNPSPVRVDLIGLIYNPTGTGGTVVHPQIPPRFETRTVIIQPDSSQTVSIKVIDESQTSQIANIMQRGSAFDYQVIMQVRYTEVYSGRTQTYTVNVTLTIKETAEGETCTR
ncbi:MAG: hypothetical protein NZ526_01250 [Aquificaceae bacterium]|nr:hypothetical protein [Aquificaceae bacterium]